MPPPAPSSTPQLNRRQGPGGRRAGPLWVEVDVLVVLAFEWQLLQRAYRRRKVERFQHPLGLSSVVHPRRPVLPLSFSALNQPHESSFRGARRRDVANND
ncbi:hypothetical protein Rt10032_c09g3769 [Rhodotorula toruloides]|uniref:Uncharacterized protein n=1 Tax=Rhodotorula toruloides TaxID=5286 RepID=A0A511KHB9_RHOTO|nr:hypothetical protein Rt10032_c02g1108 [Rhodotorula toruloides]GEM09752.1 hypothetical protein Rt10032_c09g3769 [Rhodotorula toruloides]